MMPSIDLRLASMIRSVQEVILPALSGHSGLAQEQAHLLLGQLMVLRSQVDGALAFERIEATSLADLASELARTAKGGGKTEAAAAALAALLKGATGEHPAEVRQFLQACSLAVEALIGASGEDGSEAFQAASAEAILRHGRQAALRNRRWFSATNFEAPEVRLPPLDPLAGD